ncbi:MAG: DUF4344 domain-containing metallopeptidase [Cyanobacteria bacterium P01_H01_bin.162]
MPIQIKPASCWKAAFYAAISLLLVLSLPKKAAQAILPAHEEGTSVQMNATLAKQWLLSSSNKQADTPLSFSVTYTPAETQRGQEVQDFLQEAQVFEQLLLGLNDVFVLPEPITLNQAECGTVNAYYSPSDRQITMCYELVDYFFTLFAEHRQPGDPPIELPTISVLAFVMLHELGHGFIDVLDVPVLGREEDAVDQFAAVLLAQTGGGQVTAEAAATWFYLSSQQQDYANIPYWAEHSLDIQRFHSIVCMLYGSSPETYGDLMQELDIPERRQAMCQQEYADALENWGEILDPIRIEPEAG